MTPTPAFVRRLPPPPRRAAQPAAKPSPARQSWVGRWFGRREPSTYQRCLAIHIHYAAPRSALS